MRLKVRTRSKKLRRLTHRQLQEVQDVPISALKAPELSEKAVLVASLVPTRHASWPSKLLLRTIKKRVSSA